MNNKFQFIKMFKNQPFNATEPIIIREVTEMKYIVDHDYHIHSQLSSCSRDPEQTPERILRYAKDNGLTKLVLTDHYWDSAVEGASN